MMRVVAVLGTVMVLVAGTANAVWAVSYRRWTPKTYSCTTGSGHVSAVLPNQDVEFSDLPTGAQFTINYIDNGVVQTDGPYTVEQTSGTKSYGSFAEPFDAYPFTFEFRLDTLVNGQVVYRSSLQVACSGDTSGQATIVNETGPLPTTTTTTVTSTTSTTTPACLEAATVESIDCRLGELLAGIDAATPDTTLRAALAVDVNAATAAVEAAGTASSLRIRKRDLGRAAKQLARLAGKVRHAALDGAGRATLLRGIAGLRSDLIVLRATTG